MDKHLIFGQIEEINSKLVQTCPDACPHDYSYLTECCIKASHHNASFFIEHFTAEEIARLLKREDLSITDVAYQLDFNTTNYFTRYVKRVLGMTPSQYKAKFSVKQ